MTGAGGFIGRMMIEYLNRLEPRPHVVCCDRLPEPGLDPDLTSETPGPHPAGPKCASQAPASRWSNWMVGNLRDFGCIRNLIVESTPDIVLHLAGRTPPCEDAELWTDNLGATVNLLEAARSVGHPVHLLVVGSAAEYGPAAAAGSMESDAPPPQREDDDCRPTTTYGRSKLAQTLLCREYAERFGVHAVVVRPFNLIGPGTPEHSVVGTICSQLTRGPAPTDSPPPPAARKVIHLGNTESARDFIDVRDAVCAFWIAATRGVPGGIYNVCSGQAVVIRQIAERLAAMTGRDVRLEAEAERLRAGDVTLSCGDPARLKALGWEPRIDLNTSLADTLAAYQKLTTEN